MAKRGRKPLPPDVALGTVLAVRVTPPEFLIITRAAKKARKSRADFVREAIQKAIKHPCNCAA